ncbi:hypothetical protein [Spartinivicinus ruber]|uniref:hypothetical protein n=1 Tax=Spartinivicinus ruber TaxID=2683272 RepID=UPI0013D77FDB|nr:hypothetical protein [Spartinivicinus ruber]
MSIHLREYFKAVRAMPKCSWIVPVKSQNVTWQVYRSGLSTKIRDLRRQKHMAEADAVLELQQAIEKAISFHLIRSEDPIPDEFC